MKKRRMYFILFFVVFVSLLLSDCVQKKEGLVNNITVRNRIDPTSRMDKRLVNALKSNDVEQVAELFRNSVDSHAKGDAGYDAMSYAVMLPDTKMITFLLSKGLNLSNKDLLNRDVLSIALSKENTPIVKYLIEEKKFIVNTDHFSQLCRINLCSKKQLENKPFDLFLYLLSQGGDLDIKNSDLISSVGLGGNIKILNFLATKGMVFDASTLWWALYFRRKAVVYLLIDKYNVSLKSQKIKDKLFFPLHDAISFSDSSIVTRFIEKGANINQRNNDGELPIDKAINSQKIDIIQLLLKNGATWDNKQILPLTLIHFSMNDWLYLKSLGVSFDTKDERNQNIFHAFACIKTDSEREEKFNFVLKNVDSKLINELDKDHISPFFNSLMTGCDSVLFELFIRNGADVNAQLGRTASTPLMFLVQQKAVFQIETILNLGADITPHDNCLKTAYDYALNLKDSPEKTKILSLLNEAEKKCIPHSDSCINKKRGI